MRKLGLLVLSLGLVGTILSGCGGSASTEKSVDSKSADKNTTASNDKIVIGFSQHRIAGSDWYKMLIEGAKYQAEKDGATLLVADAGGDAVRQNSDIQNMLSRGAKGIVVNALDPRGIAGTIADLKKENIPVVAVNSRLSPDLEKQTLGFVAEDQLATAGQAGEQLAKILTTKYTPNDKIKVAVIGGYSGESTTAMRQQGFEKGFKGYLASHPGPKVEILPTRYGEWLPDKARGPIQQLATANPDLKAVFSMSDVMYPGIEQGLKEGGLSDKVTVVSYDGDMSVVKKMMDNPKGPLQATISNTPYIQGAQAVQLVIDAIKGNKRDLPDGVLFTDSVLITPDNAKQYYDASKPYYYSEDALKKIQ
jgi:ribose transport system substrate-binding protein